MGSIINNINEVIRAFSLSRKRMSDGFKRFSGDADTICRHVVNSCWNGDFFMTSSGHFANFWVRDFGWCSESLCDLGFKDKVVKSLDYAFNIFDKQGLGTMITPDGVSINHPGKSVDSLPWLVRALRASKDDVLLSKFEGFINRESRRLFNQCIDKSSGLVRQGYYASIKDLAVRHSSTYDNSMIAMLSDDLDFLGLCNPFRAFDIKALMLKHLWSGSFFFDDLINKQVSSDANIFPFFTKVFTDKRMIKSAINSIIDSGLDKPLPVKYSVDALRNHIIGYFLINNYQGNTVWTHMGPLFIKLLSSFDRPKALNYKRAYARLIEGFGTYLEILNPDLTPFRTYFYMTDEAMLWAANFLTI